MKAARAAALAVLAAEEGEREDAKEGKMEESGSRKEDEEGREEGGEDEEDAELMALLNQGGGPTKKKKDKKGGKGGGKGGREGGREGGMAMAVEDEEKEGRKEEKDEDEEEAPWKSGGGKKEQLRAAAAAAAAAAVVDSEPPPSTSLPPSAPALDRGPLPPDPPAQVGPTLEEKARASRPPPRVRIMSDGTAAAGTTFVRLDKIHVIFRNQEVIKDASWGVQTGERVGLVGPNGGGKTTQLKVLAGELDPTSGEVLKSSKNVKIAFLKQEFTDELDLDRTLKEEMLSVFGEEQEVLARLRGLEGRLEDGKEGREEGRKEGREGYVQVYE